MECMTAYAGNDLINLLIRKVHAERRAEFAGNGNIITPDSINYSFDVAEAPKATLIIASTTHNIEIDLNTRVKVRTNRVRFDRVVGMKATGKLITSNGRLLLSGMQLTVDYTGVPSMVISEVIAPIVVPKISAVLSSIPIPQLTNVFSEKLTANPSTCAVIVGVPIGGAMGNVGGGAIPGGTFRGSGFPNGAGIPTGTSVSLNVGTVPQFSGPALRVGACITGETAIAAADEPSAFNIASLSTGATADALLIGMVSMAAVNVLIGQMLPPQAHTFDEQTTDQVKLPGRPHTFPMWVGIRGTVQASPPVLNVAGGTGKVTTIVSISGLQVGTRAKEKKNKSGSKSDHQDSAAIANALENRLRHLFPEWHDVGAADIPVTITHTWRTSGQTGALVLLDVVEFHCKPSWPAESWWAHIPQGLLDTVLARFRDQISAAFCDKIIELFNLPAYLPGTRIRAKSSFDAGQPDFYMRSVRALIRIEA